MGTKCCTPCLHVIYLMYEGIKKKFSYNSHLEWRIEPITFGRLLASP